MMPVPPKRRGFRVTDATRRRWLRELMAWRRVVARLLAEQRQ